MLAHDDKTIAASLRAMLLVEEHRALIDINNTSSIQRTNLNGTWVDWEWQYLHPLLGQPGFKHYPIDYGTQEEDGASPLVHSTYLRGSRDLDLEMPLLSPPVSDLPQKG